jgi:AcrR family transcriptional regulator
MPRKTAAEKRAETRANLIEAATASFKARGYHAASMDEISDRAGYSHGAIYSNFKGKEALFLACVAHRSEAVTALWEDFIAKVRKSGAGAENVGKALVEALPDQQWTKAILEFRVSTLSDDSRDALLAEQRNWLDIVTRLLAAYCESNGLTPPRPLESLAEAMTAMVDGLRLYALVDPEVDIGRVFATTLDALLAR